MDFADIKRRAEAAREFQLQVRDMGFTVRLPTQHEVQVQAARAGVSAGGERDPAMTILFMRTLLERCVVAWAGVTNEHLAPGAGAEAAPLSPAAVGLLLDADAQVSERLFSEFIDQQAKRNARQDTAAKN